MKEYNKKFSGYREAVQHSVLFRNVVHA